MNNEFNKTKYYLMDLPNCAKSALENTVKLVLVFSVINFFIVFFSDDSIQAAIESVYKFALSVSPKLLFLFFCLITFLRFYSKMIYLKKNYTEGTNANELHEEWKKQ